MARPRRMASQRGKAPTALQSVLNSIARTAADLCEARDARIALLDGDAIQLAAFVGAPLRGPIRHPIDRSTPHGDAIVSRRVLHVRDMQQVAAARRYPRFVEVARLSGMRTVLVAPLLRDGAVLGTILIRRDRVQPFTAKQIALLKTFADQAAIAIENARLSEELGARNRDLAAALEQQTATSEVLSVISQSQTDVQPVFDTIVESAATLCAGSFSALFSFDGQLMHLVATHNWAHDALEVARQMWPAPPTTELMSGRAILERTVVHVADVRREHQSERAHELLVDIGSRSVVAVPMLRDGVPLGAIAVARAEPGLFADSEVALLKTFADQAVIAIENVRLFTELQDRNRSLSEALEQQTATAEILSVISRSPTELQPVLDAVAESAARVCGANDALMRLVDGQSLRLAAHYGPLPDLDRTIPLNRESATGRAILDGEPVHIHDLAAMPESEMGVGRSLQRRFGHRTVLAIPLLRQGAAIGAFLIRRLQVQPFSEKQIALLKTFADQAVIAIENVRLFTELQERNRSLSEALDQQTATSEVLKVISRSAFDLDPVLHTLVENAARLCNAEMGAIFRPDGDDFHSVADHGTSTEMKTSLGHLMLPGGRRSVTGRAALERRTIHVPNVLEDPEYARSELQMRLGSRTILAVPMLREGTLLGVFALWNTRVQAFTDKQIELVTTFADQAVIAIENVRLFTELQARNRDLTEALDQQTATAAILRAISSSPTDTQPVFDGIVHSALRLLDGRSALVLLVRGDELHLAALTSVDPASDAAVRANFPLALTRAAVATEVVRTGQPYVVADVEKDPMVTENIRGTAPLRGYRSMVHVPMLRDGAAVGVISVTRREAGAFSDEEVQLLRTFADQAVIAIENVRLFRELEARNAALAESLDQQTAMAEILGVIARSPTDVQPVLDAVAESAARLCGATDALIMRVDGGMLYRGAHVGDLTAVTTARPLTPDTPTGRAIVQRRIVHVADILAEIARGDYAEAEALQRAVGFRTILSIPLMREESVIGAITIRRLEVRPFTDAQVALVKTFADQAVIAIENVRLFNELQARNRDLTESLERQTATSEILGVISQSPTDVEPVFDAILANATPLCKAQNGILFLTEGEEWRPVAWRNTPAEFIAELDKTRRFGPNVGLSRVAREKRPIHIPDLMADAAYREGDPTRLATVGTAGARVWLGVPLLKGETLIGAIVMYRREPEPFVDTQIELLETFADQAVIAIENVRLFKELQQRNTALTEALEQRTATAEILRAIAASPTDLQPVLDTIARNAARVCAAADASVALVNGEIIRIAARFGPLTTPLGLEVPLDRGAVSARAVIDVQTIHVVDAMEVSEVEFPITRKLAREFGHRSAVATPLVRKGEALGMLFVRRTEVRPFTEREIELLQTFSDQAVIAIENVRLFKELEEKNRALTAAHARVSEALEQQTATSEILRVISESPTNYQPVFDAIVRHATTVCGAFDAILNLVEDDAFVRHAHHGPIAPPSKEKIPLHGTVTGLAIREARTVQIEDLFATEEFPLGKDLARESGYRTVLVVPLLRGGSAIGAIGIRRTEVRPFTDKQILLLQTFADQAVIAIENVRLFKELQERNASLSEALEQQTATADILRVISGSPTDLSPVFDTILATASRLCGANFAALWRFDGTHLVYAADYNASPTFRETLVKQPMLPGTQGPARRAASQRRVVHVADMTSEPGFKPIALQFEQARTVLAVPLLREQTLVGVLAMWRREVRSFSDQQVALVKTFADQAVIAIENVRLFTELEEKNRALTVAHAEVTATLEQQTAMAEILRVISTSPTHLQPVLDAVVKSAVRFCGAYDASIFQIDGPNLRADAHHGPIAQPQSFRVPILHGTVAGRSVLERRVISVTDLQAETEQFPEGSALAKQTGQRATLSAPLLREGEPTGAILLRRDDAVPFTDKQVALLRTFADQAVIAIENVRLFKELEARNAALAESLEQQTATADILRVISASPTDVQPVLDAVAEAAARLCGANDAVIRRVEGDFLSVWAHHGDILLPASAHKLPITRGRAIGHAVLEKQTIHIHDIAELQARGEYPEARPTAQEVGYRTMLITPLVREGIVIGVILIRRMEVRPFSDKQVELLQTFADQAVIAIENVRLFNELQASNRELTTALDQQTATSDILRVISRSQTDVQPVFQAIIESAARLLSAYSGTMTEVVGDRLELVAFTTTVPEGEATLKATFPLRLDSGSSHAVTIRARAPLNVADAETDSRLIEASRAIARARGYRSQLVVPLLHRDAVVGTISLTRRETGGFRDDEVALLQTFADQAVIAIENVRLFTELQASNRELTTALEQQTATADVLKVISRSTFDLQPVLNTLIESATRLCGGAKGFIFRRDGDVYRGVADYDTTPEHRDYIHRHPVAAGRDTVVGRVALERRTLHFPDILADPEYRWLEAQRLAHFRTVLGVPMLREGAPLGVFFIWREEVRPFTDKQIELVTTFADQAVIAIENVRLFTELQTRTRDLTRSVDQLTALGEVGQAVSSTLELQTVLTTIASRAAQLAGARSCTVYEYDEAAEEFHLRATHNVDERVLAVTRVRPIRKGEGVAGRVADTHGPVQIEDISADQAYHGALREVLLAAGIRGVLAVPLLRERRLIGSLIVTRNTPGRFADEVVALLQTFATQSAIAIQNARLFRELEAQGQALAEASRHKSQFLANMSHELRTPMNAILGYTELIADGIYGEVPDKMRDVLTRVEGSGRHLLGLINDVLDLSKIEAGQLTLTLADYAMKEIVEAVTAAAEPLAAAKNLRFIVDVAPGLPTGRGDQRRLAQVLLNLVGNAIKFTDAGHVALRIGAAAELFSIAVSDTGPGIAPADQERIFEEFQQADTSTTRPKGGTGLGLAIARRIVAMHGGRLWVESALGEGATFRLTLPVRTDKQVIVREATA